MSAILYEVKLGREERRQVAAESLSCASRGRTPLAGAMIIPNVELPPWCGADAASVITNVTRLGGVQVAHGQVAAPTILPLVGHHVHMDKEGAQPQAALGPREGLAVNVRKEVDQQDVVVVIRQGKSLERSGVRSHRGSTGPPSISSRPLTAACATKG